MQGSRLTGGESDCTLIGVHTVRVAPMNDERNDTTLGEWLRQSRSAKSISLRGLAERLQVTPSYLSDIENDRRVPAEDVLRRMAGLLELDFEDMMVRAGRFGEDAERYLRKQPEAVRLFRRISEVGLTADQLRKLQEQIVSEGGEG